MPVFGPLGPSNTGARVTQTQSPMSAILAQYPNLSAYAGQLGIGQPGMETATGYQTTPPMLYSNQPGMGVSTVQNTPPVLEGIDPSNAESITGQLASGNAEAGASVPIEQQRGGHGRSPMSSMAQSQRVTPSSPGSSAGRTERPAPDGPPIALPPVQPAPAPAPAPAPVEAGGSGPGTGGSSPTGGSSSGDSSSGGDSGSGGTSGGTAGTPGGEEGSAGDSAGGAGGSGGGGGGGKVICNALHAAGYLSGRDWEADELFGKVLRDFRPDILAGYHRWAVPVAEAMEGSPFLTWLISFPALAWARELSYSMGYREKGSLLGKVIMKLGIPICKRLGRGRV